LRLRLAGCDYDEIAKAMHCSSTTARHHVHRALRDARRDPAVTLLRLELDRLDRLQLSVWQRALNGDGEALDRVLKLMARRAKLLGLDAPARHEVRELGVPAAESEPDLTPEEIDAWAETWLRHRAAAGAGEGRSSQTSTQS
jgi:hypothetical protein